jgi:hypothetical protein
MEREIRPANMPNPVPGAISGKFFLDNFRNAVSVG